MTSRQLYEGVLIELNKENAPNILLEDFNYFANKAINNYINKRYNIYDINQQTTDDLRVLKATAMLKPRQITDYLGLTMAGKNKMATFEVVMPSDYLHILNCICIYKVHKTYKCYNAGDTWRSPATRLTADMYSLVLDNFWNKPTYKRPYYYIHNVNSVRDTSFEDRATIPTNPVKKKYLRLSNGTENSIIEWFKRDHSITEGNVILTYDDNYSNNGKIVLKHLDDNVVIPIYFFYNHPEFEIDVSDLILDSGGTDVNNITNTNTYRYQQPNNSTDSNYGDDGNNNFIYQGEGLPDTIKIRDNEGIIVEASNRERGLGIRYGNVSEVRLEIRYGQ